MIFFTGARERTSSIAHLLAFTTLSIWLLYENTHWQETTAWALCSGRFAFHQRYIWASEIHCHIGIATSEPWHNIQSIIRTLYWASRNSVELDTVVHLCAFIVTITENIVLRCVVDLSAFATGRTHGVAFESSDAGNILTCKQLWLDQRCVYCDEQYLWNPRKLQCNT